MSEKQPIDEYLAKQFEIRDTIEKNQQIKRTLTRNTPKIAPGAGSQENFVANSLSKATVVAIAETNNGLDAEVKKNIRVRLGIEEGTDEVPEVEESVTPEN